MPTEAQENFAYWVQAYNEDLANGRDPSALGMRWMAGQIEQWRKAADDDITETRRTRMNTIDREARIKLLRDKIKLLRQHAHEGHMPYVIDALELIVDLLEDRSR